MIDFGRFLLGGALLGGSLKDLSLGGYSMDTILTYNGEEESFKALHFGFLLGEIRILIPKRNG